MKLQRAIDWIVFNGTNQPATGISLVRWNAMVKRIMRKQYDHLETFKKENTMKRSGYTAVEAVVSLVLLATIFVAGLGWYRLFSLLVGWVF